MAQQYQQPENDQPSYNAPPMPAPHRQLDPWTIGVFAAGGLVLMMCMVAGCIALIALTRTPPPPATAAPQLTSIAIGLATPIPTPIPIVVPTLNPASVGVFVNPYVSANLQSMTSLAIDILNPQTNVYERKYTLVGDQLSPFVEALNISVVTTRPDTSCPDHVKFTITRSDNSQAIIGVCLKGGVILRGADIPDLGAADAPMGPRFIDVLSPYLPPEYQQLIVG